MAPKRELLARSRTGAKQKVSDFAGPNRLSCELREHEKLRRGGAEFIERKVCWCARHDGSVDSAGARCKPSWAMSPPGHSCNFLL